jgi:hypothetical protein
MERQGSRALLAPKGLPARPVLKVWPDLRVRRGRRAWPDHLDLQASRGAMVLKDPLGRRGPKDLRDLLGLPVLRAREFRQHWRHSLACPVQRDLRGRKARPDRPVLRDRKALPATRVHKGHRERLDLGASPAR